MFKCQYCEKELSGLRTKFCSQKCQNLLRRKIYKCKICGCNLFGRSQVRYCDNCSCSKKLSQKEIGSKRKKILIEKCGGCCTICGYNKCLRAMSFHHKDKTTKLFTLDCRNLSNRSWDSILRELAKCELVCMNCHFEVEETLFEKS
jgi:hypothetical protein